MATLEPNSYLIISPLTSEGYITTSFFEAIGGISGSSAKEQSWSSSIMHDFGVRLRIIALEEREIEISLESDEDPEAKNPILCGIAIGHHLVEKPYLDSDEIGELKDGKYRIDSRYIKMYEPFADMLGLAFTLD